MSNEPSLIDLLGEFLTEEDFFEEPYRMTAHYVYTDYAESKTINPAKIINMFTDVDEQKTVAGIFNRHLAEENLSRQEKEKVLNELVKRIKKQNVDRLAKSATTPEELQKLMKMMIEMQKMHISL